MSAADGYVINGSRAESDGLGNEISDSVGAVAVRDLVEARVVAALGLIEGLTLLGVARERRVRRGGSWLEDGVGLLVAVGAGCALQPVDVTSGVEHHVDLTRRFADSNSGEILAASLTASRHNGALYLLSFEFWPAVERFKIRGCNASDGQI